MPPGSASACRRAATFTPSPNRSSPSTITSPRLMPMRNSSRRSFGSSALRAASSSWISTAHLAASTALGNSASTLSPAVPTIAAVAIRDQRVHLLPIGAQRAERAFLVSRHETAVALHVGTEDGRELTLDARRGSRLLHCAPGRCLQQCAVSVCGGGLASQLTASSPALFPSMVSRHEFWRTAGHDRGSRLHSRGGTAMRWRESRRL